MGAAAELQRASAPARTTRTDEPYLSPKKAMAPMSPASSREVSVVSTSTPVEHGGVGQREDLVELLGGGRRMMREVEAQVLGRHQGALLAHVVAQHRPQGRVQQVRGGVVAPDGLAALAVDGGQRVLSRPHLAASPAPGARPAPAPRARCRRTSAMPDSVTMVPVSPTWPPLSA